MSVLVKNKVTCVYSDKVITFGGSALLNAAAYKLIKTFEYNAFFQHLDASTTSSPSSKLTKDEIEFEYQLILVKAMFAAAKSDGHINLSEQLRIVAVIGEMAIDPELKSIVADLLCLPISVSELVNDIKTFEQKSQIYMTSCLVIDVKNPLERQYLNQLKEAMYLPDEVALDFETETHHIIMEPLK